MKQASQQASKPASKHEAGDRASHPSPLASDDPPTATSTTETRQTVGRPWTRVGHGTSRTYIRTEAPYEQRARAGQGL